ncbi:MAG: type I restriction enzyme HsdR N-terminal domain-containing protein, partial [Patescibacteria group bacterium]|nr:type I restriction enzyme HsdR N-terminal domain-containing protein [Patescibacteria group bacterium]
MGKEVRSAFLELIDDAVKMLIEKYGYPRERIRTDYQLSLIPQEPMAEPQKVAADIIVLDPSEQAEIIVQVKSPYKKLYTENHTENLIFVMINSELKYAMLYNGQEKYCFKKILGTQAIEIPDIPSFSKANLISDEKTTIQYSQYFFRTCELLRGKIPYSEYSKILISILYAKFIDEKEFNGSLLKQISNPEQIFQTFEKLFEEGNKKYQLLDVDINIIRNVSNDVLFSIISESNQFSIIETNPESIIQAMYQIMERESLLRKTSYLSIPESVSLFLYKYLVTGATSSNIKKRKLLLTDIGDGSVVFDVLRHISDEFELVGEDLKEFTRSNLEVVDKNKTIMGFLKFLLTLKGYDK